MRPTHSGSSAPSMQQYRAMDLAPLPVIAIRIERVTSWSGAGGGGAQR